MLSTGINLSLKKKLDKYDNLYIIGQGIKNPMYVFKILDGINENLNIIDMPISENLISGLGMGLAMTGSRVVIIYPRIDFIYYGINGIVNEGLFFNNIFGTLNLTIITYIGRGGGLSAKHNQTTHQLFSIFPKMNIFCPKDSQDSENILNICVEKGGINLICLDLILETSSLTIEKEKKLNKNYSKTITLLVYGYLINDVYQARNELIEMGIFIDIIYISKIKPFDLFDIIESLKNTGILCVVESVWNSGSIFSQLISELLTNKEYFKLFKKRILKISLGDSICPGDPIEKKKFYIDSELIIKSIINFLNE